MRHAGEILKETLGRLGRPAHPLDWIQAVWPVVLGARLADRAQPTAWREGALDVFVRSANWRRELEAMSESLRAELNRAWGGELVRSLRFSSDEDPPRTPFLRSGAQAGRPRRLYKEPREKK